MTVREDDDAKRWGGPVGDVDERRRASRLEILGSWLGLWTAPRGVVVPPVPKGKVALVALAVLVIAGGAFALVAPKVDDTKRRTAAEQRKIDAAQRARLRRQTIAEQTPRHGRLAAGGTTAAIGRVEEAIGRDARARFDRDARRARCERGPGGTARRFALQCASATADIVGAGDQKGARGQLAIPYVAVVDLKRCRYTFCKVNPPPGEQIIPDPREVVALPRACTVAA